jgi:hypothetical protein
VSVTCESRPVGRCRGRRCIRPCAA